MRGYRNLRVERSIMQIHRSGKQVPERYNWFYNHIFRYLMETASTECSRWAKTLTSLNPKIDVVFSHRKGFRYSQTSAYLAKLQVERRPVWYFNNRHKVDFRAADPFLIRSQRAKNDDGLQAVDCVASAIYGAIDENWLGSVVPERLSNLSPKFLRPAGRRSPAGYGFKLLPVKFDVPLTRNQKQSLHSVGYAHLT